MSEERSVILPMERVVSTLRDPLCLTVYSPPKMGKTTLLSHVPNCLILDFEGGSRYIDGMKIEVKNFKHLTQIGTEIMKAGRPYDFVAIDTLTALEDWCLWDATEFYMGTPQGKGFNRKPASTGGGVLPRSEWEPVINLPNGAGYKFLRESFRRWMDKIMKLADRVILVGHIKDKMIVDKKGNEVSASDLALTGKIKEITTQDYSDSIAYLYRDENGHPTFNFRTSDTIACGSRSKHLIGREIQMATYNDETKELEDVKWDVIYPDKLG